ncbi:hypothetical protein PBY51_022960 [Eleginops maclovinus]|uniref:Uncharacterized protein n=1 Tax=Eleginops maclovinus TaxID=56733 RepID=A0AAN7XGB5_ELEMC|nr:hypothetical protein PBY51_022960 [Eleginops maclovinus]
MLASMWASDVCTPLCGYLLHHKDASSSTDPDCEDPALPCALILRWSVNVMCERNALHLGGESSACCLC